MARATKEIMQHCLGPPARHLFWCRDGQVVDCRQVLMWTYCLAYCLDAEGRLTELFTYRFATAFHRPCAVLSLSFHCASAVRALSFHCLLFSFHGPFTTFHRPSTFAVSPPSTVLSPSVHRPFHRSFTTLPLPLHRPVTALSPRTGRTSWSASPSS